MHNQRTIRTALAAFKGNIYQNIYVPELSYPPLTKYINLKGLRNKIFSCMRCHLHRMHDFCVQNRSYLGEFEAEFKKALARESGAQGGII
jgi:hypothetical protein